LGANERDLSDNEGGVEANPQRRHNEAGLRRTTVATGVRVRRLDSPLYSVAFGLQMRRYNIYAGHCALVLRIITDGRHHDVPRHKTEVDFAGCARSDEQRRCLQLDLETM